MDIDIDNNEISILQLSDSFFPTGLYATSSGLEALSQTKKLKSKDISQIYYYSFKTSNRTFRLYSFGECL